MSNGGSGWGWIALIILGGLMLWFTYSASANVADFFSAPFYAIGDVLGGIWDGVTDAAGGIWDALTFWD